MSALVISEPGTRISVDHERFLVKRGEETARYVRCTDVSEILLFGPVELSHAATALCLRRAINVCYLTTSGKFLGRLVGPDPGNAPLRLAQYEATRSAEAGLAIAKRIVRGKIANQRALLLRAQRTLRDARVTEALARLRRLGDTTDTAVTVDQVRGFEGAAAAAYFGAFPAMIKNPVFEFSGRKSRPPTDPLNAMLSFGYTLLGTIVESAVGAAGLDTGFGFLHTPTRGRASLALDLLEEFRPVVVDTLVLRLVNRRQVAPTDFECPDQKETVASDALGLADMESTETITKPVHLAASGRAVFLGAFFARVRETVPYALLDTHSTLRDVIRQQAYVMARAIEGHPDGYTPFTED